MLKTEKHVQNYATKEWLLEKGCDSHVELGPLDNVNKLKKGIFFTRTRLFPKIIFSMKDWTSIVDIVDEKFKKMTVKELKFGLLVTGSMPMRDNLDNLEWWLMVTGKGTVPYRTRFLSPIMCEPFGEKNILHHVQLYGISTVLICVNGLFLFVSLNLLHNRFVDLYCPI